MSDDNPNHITREELRAELRALSNRHLLYLGIAVGLIRFDVPTALTAAAIGAAVLKAGWFLIFRS